MNTTKPVTIKRTTDKRGRVVFYRWSMLAMRYIRIGADDAAIMLATGQAVTS